MNENSDPVSIMVLEVIESNEPKKMLDFVFEFEANWVGEDIPPEVFDPLVRVLNWDNFWLSTYSSPFVRLFERIWSQLTSSQRAIALKELSNCVDRLVDLHARYCVALHLASRISSENTAHLLETIAKSLDSRTRCVLPQAIVDSEITGISVEAKRNLKSILQSLTNDRAKEVRENAITALTKLR